jgi:hypothetical protein
MPRVGDEPLAMTSFFLNRTTGRCLRLLGLGRPGAVSGHERLGIEQNYTDVAHRVSACSPYFGT